MQKRCPNVPSYMKLHGSLFGVAYVQARFSRHRKLAYNIVVN